MGKFRDRVSGLIRFKGGLDVIRGRNFNTSTS